MDAQSNFWFSILSPNSSFWLLYNEILKIEVNSTLVVVLSPLMFLHILSKSEMSSEDIFAGSYEIFSFQWCLSCLNLLELLSLELFPEFYIKVAFVTVGLTSCGIVGLHRRHLGSCLCYQKRTNGFIFIIPCFRGIGGSVERKTQTSETPLGRLMHWMEVTAANSSVVRVGRWFYRRTQPACCRGVHWHLTVFGRPSDSWKCLLEISISVLVPLVTFTECMFKDQM